MSYIGNDPDVNAFTIGVDKTIIKSGISNNSGQNTSNKFNNKPLI